jgi:hypothetical protein
LTPEEIFAVFDSLLTATPKANCLRRLARLKTPNGAASGFTVAAGKGLLDDQRIFDVGTVVSQGLGAEIHPL